MTNSYRDTVAVIKHGITTITRNNRWLLELRGYRAQLRCFIDAEQDDRTRGHLRDALDAMVDLDIEHSESLRTLAVALLTTITARGARLTASEKAEALALSRADFADAVADAGSEDLLVLIAETYPGVSALLTEVMREQTAWARRKKRAG